MFGASSFCPQQCMHFLGHWFHQFLYDFYLNVVLVLLQLLLKVIFASGGVFMESEVPINFTSKVFDRFHIMRLWTPWQCYDCLIGDMRVCFELLSYWNTHSTSFLRISQLTCLGCPIRCSNNAHYSFFLWLWSTPQCPPNSNNPKPWCSLHASHSYKLHIWLGVPHVSSNITLDHQTPQWWINFDMRIWLSSTAPPCNPYAILPFMR